MDTNRMCSAEIPPKTARRAASTSALRAACSALAAAIAARRDAHGAPRGAQSWVASLRDAQEIGEIDGPRTGQLGVAFHSARNPGVVRRWNVRLFQVLEDSPAGMRDPPRAARQPDGHANEREK